MSSNDRRPYLSATSLDQNLLDFCHDNLDTRLEMVVEIETPTATIYASDRNKYVGSTFYEALLKFPIINRTVGEWLTPTIQFSQLKIEISNADGRFNGIMPSGPAFGSWVGKRVTVKIGIGELTATYITIFSGSITEIGGFSRTVKSIQIVARDDYENLSTVFPNTVLTTDVFPDLDDNLIGVYLPVIYGDWTTAIAPDPAIVPAYPVNGKNASVLTGTANLEFRISETALTFFDTSEVYLRRADVMWQCPAADVTNVSGSNNYFEIIQNTASLWVDGAAFIYETGDEFFVLVQGKDLSGYDDNIVWQARDILITHGGATVGQFDASWTTYRDKNAPSQSAIASIKSRIWENEPKPAIEYALSLLEQVRLESFINNDLKLQINSLHFEDFNSAPSFMIRNWDVVKDTFQPVIDTRNNFNRAQGVFDFHPIDNENARRSRIHKNAASITQVGKQISKEISFPNLYVLSQVESQLVEILRLASAMIEFIPCTLTWRSLLQDIGDFSDLNVQIGSSIFENVPVMIRDLGYDPNGSIPVLFWSFAMCPFPGYEPGYNGTVGGYNATIDVET